MTDGAMASFISVGMSCFAKPLLCRDFYACGISYIERFNLTLRQRVSYLQRKTLGYCKKKANFTDALWINLYDYNYRCPHKSLRLPLPVQGVLRFQKKWMQRTHAMAMGLTQEALTWRFLFVMPVPVTR
jgi:hypothetical protein